MSCEQCLGIESVFGNRIARLALRRYRRRGPSRMTTMLLERLVAEGVDGLTVLDVGGGIGTIPNELLGAGARSATLVEASGAYLAAARAEAGRQGHLERIRFCHGDFVQLAAELDSADMVTLDRALCCYDDVASLVAASAGRANGFYGLVYPRDTWWNRWGVAAVNLLVSLTRNPFRAFVHASPFVERIAADNGFSPIFRRNLGLWQVVFFRRS
jgi:SAM-dependent methyltransferase